MIDNLKEQENIAIAKIESYFKNNGLILSSTQSKQFYDYYVLLIEWNKKFNLTSITQLEDVIAKHFFDSAVAYKEFKQDASVIDIGCGAGFPSIPLKIMRPDLKFLLVDSVNKKISFVQEVINVLKLNNITALHSRAEDLAYNPCYRQKFDYSVARAVANLTTLCEYCLPFVSVGGNMFAYKASNTQEEVETANNAINLLGGKIDKVIDFSVEPYCRKIIKIKKQSSTPNKYPRKNNKPRTNPLG